MWTVRDGFFANGLAVDDDDGENTGGVAKLLQDGEAYEKSRISLVVIRAYGGMTAFSFTLTAFFSSLCFEFGCRLLCEFCDWNESWAAHFFNSVSFVWENASLTDRMFCFDKLLCTTHDYKDNTIRRLLILECWQTRDWLWPNLPRHLERVCSTLLESFQLLRLVRV